jgi:lysophospholipase L1-like esterase
LTYVAIAPNVKRWPIIDQTRETNRLIRNLARNLKPPLFEFVEIEDKLLGKDGQPQPNHYIADGLHLNDAGYEILTNAVRPHLK